MESKSLTGCLQLKLADWLSLVLSRSCNVYIGVNVFNTSFEELTFILVNLASIN